MARKSTLKTLPPQVQAAVVQALEKGATIDDITAELENLGHKRSRSAVGRYAKDYSDLASRHRDLRVVAEAFAGEFGGTDNAEGKLMVQMLTSVGARMILPIAAGEVEDVSPKDFNFLAKATKELLTAAKVDAERDAKLREEAKKEAREQAAEDGAEAARQAGASDETVARVKNRILGLEG